MGTYINPPDRVKDIGRPLTDATAPLEPGECLVGLYDRGMFKNAVVLKSSWLEGDSEFMAFENQAVAGMISREGFFDVREELVK